MVTHVCYVWETYAIPENQKYTHRKKNKGKTLNKQVVIYNKKINLMKIDFTYGRKFS